MKKIYFLLFSLMISTASFGQDLVITGVIDGPLPGGTPKGLELYVINDITDLSIYGIESTTNANPSSGTQEFTFPADAVTSGSFIYIASEAPNFTQYMGIAPDYTDSVVNVNGDDSLLLYLNGTVVDALGEAGTDGTGQPWEYLDGWAYRNNSTGPNATFTVSEWTFSGANAIDGCDLSDDTGTNAGCSSVFPIGTFTYTGTPCGVSLGAATFVCDSNTIGDNNDTVTIEIPYTGSDATIASVTTTSTGVVAGDDPATVVDGIITITGLSEGDAWDIVLNGGNCDTNSASGNVPADQCDPAPNTCFDLSTGAELFELVTITTNSDMDEWTNTAGTYAMNGFCGGGCAEPIEGWLIFGPLDTTSITDLTLAFTATEQFGTTDLNVAYTASYPGCPSDATWTTVETVTASGDIEADFSTAGGTDVYIGIQYVDDGADGYSGWSLSNVALEAFGTCPTLGTRTASTCVVCELALGADAANCDANTSGVDTYTATLDFTGGGTTVYSVIADSGTVGGDDPSSVASGTITVTGINEGTDVIISIVDQGDICNLQRTITSPSCISTTCSNAGDVVITEIMQNPSVNGDPAGEFFEVFNTTSSPIDMAGWIIKDDVTASETHTITASVIIPANGYVVIANGATPNGGLSPDYTYGNDISLGNGTDGIILECSGVVIDQVIYDGGTTFPDPSGASMELSSTIPSGRNNVDNDDGTNWGVATSPYGDGDLGTPGAANDFTLSTDRFDTNGLSIYPNPTSTGYVNIKTQTSADVFVSVFNVLGKEIIAQKLSDEKLDVSSLNAGVYIMRISQNTTTSTKKLIIK